MTDYPKPATPLPWPTYATALRSVMEQQDAVYIVHTANAFPHLVAALEMVAGFRKRPNPLIGNPELAQRALAIARGETKPSTNAPRSETNPLDKGHQ